MSDFLNVSSSPHVRSGDSTRSIMFDVIIALLPATVFGVYWFKLPALITILICVVTAVLTEYLFEVAAKRKVTIMDGSAIVTGLLLALNLPPEVPFWIPIIGSVFAILFVKQLFGGLGQNFMNPALAARCFLLLSFAGRMTTFTVDGVASATPLAELKNGAMVNITDMFFGFTGGTIGEVSAIAVLIGAVYLVLRKVISLWIPLTYLISFSIFVLIFGGEGFEPLFIAAHLCGGGLMLGAFFMATDYVTSPITKGGKVLFGILLGVLTGVFRLFGPGAEGVSYAIIIANMVVPLIEKITMPTAFGYGKKKANLEQKSSGGAKKQIDAVKLCIITLVAGLLLGGVYQVTKTVIEQHQKETTEAAYRNVCPGAENFEETDALKAAVENSETLFADQAYGNIVVTTAMAAKDTGGNVVGYVIDITDRDGYGGDIQLVVGLDAEMKVTGLDILSINETAGLGMNAKNDSFRNQYIGKQVEEFSVTKTGASAENEIDALSGATITSNAVTNGVNAALKLIQSAAN